MLHNLLFNILVLPNFAFLQLEKYDLKHIQRIFVGKKKSKKKVCYLQDFGGVKKTFAKFFYNGSYV
jgi:hypothetical protein